MQITYTCSQDDFVKAGLLMARKRNRILFYMQWFGIAVLAYFVINLITDSGFRSSLFELDQIPRAVVGLGFMIFFVCIPLFLRSTLRKQFQRTPHLAETRKIEFDDIGYSSNSVSSQGRIAWSVYVAYFEDKDNFLLVQQGRIIFVPIPKRELTPDQITELRTLFDSHIPGR